MKNGEREYDLEGRSLAYATEVIRIVDRMPNTRAAAHVGGQLLRSGTAALPNHGEAQAAESPADFVHKLKLCLKELRESHRWLKLICRAGLVKDPADVRAAIVETDELVRIFVASISTSQRCAARATDRRS